MLPFKEGVYVLVALCVTLIDDVIPSLVSMECIYLIKQGIAKAKQTRCRTEMMQQYLLHLLRTYVGIACYLAIRHSNIDKRHKVTGTNTRHWLERHVDAQFTTSLFNSLAHFGSSACLATILHTYAYLALNRFLALGFISFIRISRRTLELCQYLINTSWLHMTEDFIINLHHRSQCTATKTGNLLY